MDTDTTSRIREVDRLVTDIHPLKATSAGFKLILNLGAVTRATLVIGFKIPMVPRH
jgi:hypothetical protein